MGTNDGSVVLCGYTDGNWWQSAKAPSDAHDDFAVVALASNGTELWRWQVRIAGGRHYPSLPSLLRTVVSVFCTWKTEPFREG